MSDLIDAREHSDGAEINLRILKAAAEFASKDEDRLSINGVGVEFESRATTYVATDGARLVCVREETARPNRLLGAFTVPSRHCKIFTLDKEDDGRTEIFAKGGRLTIAHGRVDVTFAPIDVQFPHWRKAMPSSVASGVLAQYQFKLLDSFRKFATALELPPPFLAPNGDGPGFVWFAGTPLVFGIIMPMRAVDQMGRSAPDWALRGGPEREQRDIEDDDILRRPADDGDVADDVVADAELRSH